MVLHCLRCFLRMKHEFIMVFFFFFFHVRTSAVAEEYVKCDFIKAFRLEILAHLKMPVGCSIDLNQIRHPISHFLSYLRYFFF